MAKMEVRRPLKNLMLSSDEDEPLVKKVKTIRTSNRTRKSVKNYKEDALLDIKEEVTNIEQSGTKRKSKRTLKVKTEPDSDYEDNNAGQQSMSTKSNQNKDKENDYKEEGNAEPSGKFSEYELMIQKNIAERQKFLASLDIFKTKDELQELVPEPAVKKPTYRGIARVKEPAQPTERRKSLRQMKLNPDGADLPLPSEKEIAKALAESSVERNVRPPPGPCPAVEYCNTAMKEDLNAFLNEVQDIDTTGGGHSVWSGDGQSIIKTMKKMKITESLVAKVVPSRTLAVQIHPTLDKTLLMVGGKYGELGLWDVERNDSSNGAHFFSPHSRPINCLTVDPWNHQNIYSTSYDSSLRKTDISTMIVQQVYSYVEEETYNVYTSWHAHRDENTILVGGSVGDVIQVDLRDNNNPVEYKMHNGKSVKVVTVHPTVNHYIATASRDGNVCLWDLRKCKKNIPVATCTHGRNVSGLEFSPVTGNSLISTCADNYLRFIACDLKDLTVQKKIHHNNQTGRWLTTFKARFLPGREDLIVVGSMVQPRRIEVWWNDGQLAHSFSGEDFGSVASVNAFHPTRAVLAGCNSSGRVHVFM